MVVGAGLNARPSGNEVRSSWHRSVSRRVTTPQAHREGLFDLAKVYLYEVKSIMWSEYTGVYTIPLPFELVRRASWYT